MERERLLSETADAIRKLCDCYSALIESQVPFHVIREHIGEDLQLLLEQSSRFRDYAAESEKSESSYWNRRRGGL